MTLLAGELGIQEHVHPMEHVYEPSYAPESVIEEDVFLIPFDENTGAPSSSKSVWDLRVGRVVRLTGGTYEGSSAT